MTKYLVLFLLALTACTNNFEASNTINVSAYPTIPIPDSWCKFIPEKYRHYIPDCSSPQALTKPVVAALYPSYSSWNDYVRVNDTSTACDGSETSYDACLNGGTRRLVTTTETSCASITLTDSLGAFDWVCSMVGAQAAFTGALRGSKGLQHLISGTTFIPMYVILSKGTNSIHSDTTTWWTNTITTLPNNSSTGAASATLSTAGTIYVTSSDINTSGYNITADRVSLVTLADSTVYRNAKAGTDTNLDGTVGSGYRTVLSTGGHKFLWIEGSYDMNDSNTGGEFTVFLSNTKLSTLKLVEANQGFPIYLYGCTYNILDHVLATNSSDFGITLDGSNSNRVVDSSANDNPNHYGLAIGGSSGNSVYNFKVDNSFGGLRVWSTTGNNTIDNMLITNVTSGVYLVGNSIQNHLSNITTSNVSANSGIYIDRTDDQVISNLLIDTCHYGVTLSEAHTNQISSIHVKNCDTGILEYDGYGTTFSGEVWLDNNSTDCNNTYGGNPGFNTDCTASGSSTHTLVNSSTNKYGYQL